MTDLVFHFILFAIGGVGILLAPLVIGLFVRPTLPTDQKDSIYECGEPTIGSSYIQFDLRFYTVALLFIIFDVEVAFFFPWAAVYGGSMQLADEQLSDGARLEVTKKLLNQSAGSQESVAPIEVPDAQTIGLTGLMDILVFFGVLLVGFAYVWKRGDLDWVRAVAEKHKAASFEQPAAGNVEQTEGAV